MSKRYKSYFTLMSDLFSVCWRRNIPISMSLITKLCKTSIHLQRLQNLSWWRRPFKICVIDWQSYPSLCDTPFSLNSMIRHYGFYTKYMISHYTAVLWLDSDGVVTVHSSTSGTSGRLQNRVSVPPWFLHSNCVYRVPASCWPCSDWRLPTRCLVDRFSTLAPW